MPDRSSRRELPVTVVIPTFNRAAFLREAIRSILHQTARPERILVVDDGSTDGTPDVAGSYEGRVEYLPKPNGGKSSALNLALRDVGSELVWIFDDDDIALPEALETLAGGLRAAPECGFSYGSYSLLRIKADGTRSVTEREFPEVAPEELFIALMGRPFIHQPGLLVRRHCYEAVGPFDEAMIRSQDYEMMLRLARRFRGVQVPGPLFLQRQHEGVRGTRGFAVPAAAVKLAWKRFDQATMRRLHEACGLEEFLPQRAPPIPLGSQDRFSALLQRSTMMGRRGLWDLAAQDLEEAVRLANDEAVARLSPAQSAILHRLFDAFSDGAPEFADAQAYRRALARVGSPSLARDLRLGMSWNLPHRIRMAAESRSYAEAALYARIFRQVAPPSVIGRILLRKLRAKLPHRLPAPPPRMG